MKNKKLKSALISILVFLMIVGGIHIMLIDYVLPENYKQLQVAFIYVFLGTLSILGISAIFLVHKNDDSLIGKGFLAYTVFKILGSLAFLAPWLLNQDELTRPFVYQFFAIFFPSLLVETMLILKLVNLVEKEKIKNDQNQLEK
jgi:hypothetical protein